MNPISTRVLLLLFFSSLVVAVNFTQCLEDFRQNSSAVGGVDSQGFPVTNATEAVGLTYLTCIARCGTGWESFNFKQFIQMFASWFLPWLALLSQLPFGSSNYADDFVSVVMSLGSPALAAYSLVLTSLNARSVYKKMKNIKCKHKKSVADALISIQQIPVDLTDDSRLLDFIPDDPRWRNRIDERLSRRGSWSFAAAMSIAWVVIAFLLTLIDSFVSLGGTVDITSQGQAVGTVWLWLLCLVIGWMWVPIFNSVELSSALISTNKGTAKMLKDTRRKAGKAMGTAKTKLVGEVPKKLEGFKEPTIAVAPPDSEDQSFQEDIKHVEEETDQKTNPLLNPSHHRSAVSFQTHPESQQGHDHPSISANPDPNQSAISVARSTQPSIDPDMDELFIPLKLTSLNRDEHRISATFNYSRTMRYLALVDDVLRILDKSTRVKYEKRRSASGVTPTLSAGKKVVFPPGVFSSMFNAAIMAFMLQCGTIAAAVVIILLIPPPDLECSSLGYIIYGGVSIIIMFLNIISTILARISDTREKKSANVEDFTAYIAIALRKISLFLALINGTGLIALSCLEFANLLDNCYCNASVLGSGVDSYIIVFYNGSLSSMRNSRIAATFLSVVVVAIYMIFLWLMTILPDDLSPPLHDVDHDDLS